LISARIALSQSTGHLNFLTPNLTVSSYSKNLQNFKKESQFILILYAKQNHIKIINNYKEIPIRGAIQI